MAQQVFQIVRRTETTGLKACPAAIALGFLILWSSEGILKSYEMMSSISSAVAFVLIGGGIFAFIIFGVIALFSYEEIVRFRQVKAIVVADQGIAFQRKDGSSQIVLQWQNIKSVEYRGIKWLFVGLMETSREPVLTKFLLVDGSTFSIPLDILKKHDRIRMMTAVQSYLSLANR